MPHGDESRFKKIGDSIKIFLIQVSSKTEFELLPGSM